MLVFNTLHLETYLYSKRSANDGCFQSVNVLFDPHNLHKAAQRLQFFVVFAVLEDSTMIWLHTNVNQYVFYIEMHCKRKWARPK